MKEKSDGTFAARALDAYMNNRYLVAASSALCMGLFGFCFGLMLASVCTSAFSVILLVGAVGGLGLATLDLIANGNSKHTAAQLPTRHWTSVYASFFGASIMFSCGASVLGIEGNLNLIVALSCAVLTSLWLNFTPR